MNKKLLFAAMSFAALTACSTDDFESQQQVAEGVSPIQFEIINNSETTRASMDGNTLKWNANDGDLFTLYHGGTLSGTALTSYQNATYKANANADGPATLSTPSMIKDGRAIMVWPVDTTFYAAASGKLTVKIPVTLSNIENNIPYASDLLTIQPYAAYSETATAPATPTAYNTAGKDRKYQIHMRPMASQLILKADYAGTDAVINALTTGADPINPIALTSVEINDPTNTSLTKEIDLSFATPVAPQGTNWTKVKNNAWTEVTGFDITSAVGAGQLTTKCINGIESAKFLMLPQANIGGAGLAGASVVVNTIYGKVAISAAGGYTAAELGDAWYRYAAAGAGAGTYTEYETSTAGTGSDANKVKYTNNIERGLAQVIDAFSTNNTTKATSVVVSEPTGAVGTRYVKVLLTKLDMDGLHVKTDKQLYDAVRVWKEIGADGVNVTVKLDGDAKGNFEISQKTIAKINEINADLAEETTPRKFKVTACNAAGETCNTIVITGGDEIAADLSFIVNTTAAADVALKAGETWKWAASTTAAKTITVDALNNGIRKIINKGTFVSDATATLKIMNNASPSAQIFSVPFENASGAKWDIKAGTLNVQFNVTNNGTVSIATGAQYRQDGQSVATKKTTFENNATTLPQRFLAANKVESIGKVYNSGVFATVGDGEINNYGLIEHGIVSPDATPNENAKTYITSNQVGGNFASPFNATTNKIGTVNLPWSLKGKVDNVSISAALSNGFVSVTVTKDVKALTYSAVGSKVNTVVVNGGVETIGAISGIKYLEINQPNTEIAITEDLKYNSTASSDKSLSGLVILSDVKVNQGKTVAVKEATYLGSDLYVGGKFQHVYGTPKAANDAAATDANWSGYYGNTTANFATKYITY